MIGKRFIDGDKLVERLRTESLEAPLTADFIAYLLARAPKMPKLIGRQRAAEILGVGSPYVSQLPLQRIKVEGGKDAYDEAEVKALARQRVRDRKEKS